MPALGYIFLFSLVFLASLQTAFSQILNIERTRISRDSSDYWTGKGSLNFSMFNRNAGKNNPNNYLSLTGTADVAYMAKLNSYMLLNNINYVLINYSSGAEKNVIANNGYTHLRVNLLRGRRLSYELFTQYQYDDARGLHVRLLNGGGLRYRLLKKENVNFYLGTGLMWEHEEWRDPEQEGLLRMSDLTKATNYFSTKAKLSEAVDVKAIIYFQSGYDRGIGALRHRLSGDMSVGANLSKHLSLRTGFNCTFENRPLVPVTKFIYAVTNGVQFEF